LIDSGRAIVDVVVLLLALLEHLEDEIATNGRIVSVAKMLIDTLLESFDAFADFLGVVDMDQFLKDGT
jgi:hypothetical protein